MAFDPSLQFGVDGGDKFIEADLYNAAPMLSMKVLHAAQDAMFIHGYSTDRR